MRGARSRTSKSIAPCKERSKRAPVRQAERLSGGREATPTGGELPGSCTPKLSKHTTHYNFETKHLDINLTKKYTIIKCPWRLSKATCANGRTGTLRSGTEKLSFVKMHVSAITLTPGHQSPWMSI